MGFKIGLALGGGASRGLAHLGVIKVLEEAGIGIDIITGTSIGAIIGSIYAANPDIKTVIREIDAYLHSGNFQQTRLEFIKNSKSEVKSYFHQLKKVLKTGLLLALSMQKKSFISNNEFKANLEHIIPAIRIEECDVKLGLVAMNLQTGEDIMFTEGDLVECAMASSAIPGIFPPLMTDNNQILVDGSWVNPIPTAAAKKLGADFVIAVDVAPRVSEDIRIDNGWDISLRAGEGSRFALKNQNLQLADIEVPVDVMNIHWADFLQIDRCINAGKAAMEENLAQLKKKQFWRKLRRGFL